LLDDPNSPPQNYWSNTSSNDVVRDFIEKVDLGVAKGEIEALIAEETVIKTIHQELTYHNLYDSIEHLWSVLFSTGYLTQRQSLPENRYQLAIPNREIQIIFKSQIIETFLVGEPQYICITRPCHFGKICEVINLLMDYALVSLSRNQISNALLSMQRLRQKQQWRLGTFRAVIF
jgi:ABC-type sugar transport system ATPase subunit